MSQVMSSVGDTDALAAEYVLGTLDSDERALAQSLLAEDQAFVAKVKVWERRLGELHLMVEPIEPEGAIWERIKAKIPEVQQIAQVSPPEPAVVEPAPPAPGPEAPAPSPGAAEAATLDVPAPAEAAAAPTAEVTPVAPPDVTAPRTLVAPALSPSAVPPPSTAPAPVLTPGVTRAPPVASENEVLIMGRRLARWRAFAALLALVILAVAALLASWRFVPDRVPPALQPVEVMRLVGVDIAPPPPPPRPKAPPESQFDE